MCTTPHIFVFSSSSSLHSSVPPPHNQYPNFLLISLIPITVKNSYLPVFAVSPLLGFVFHTDLLSPCSSSPYQNSLIPVTFPGSLVGDRISTSRRSLKSCVTVAHFINLYHSLPFFYTTFLP